MKLGKIERGEGAGTVKIGEIKKKQQQREAEWHVADNSSALHIRMRLTISLAVHEIK